MIEVDDSRPPKKVKEMKIEMVNEEIQPTSESRQVEIAEPGFTRGPWKAVGYSPGWWQIEGPEGEQIADVNYSDGLDEPTIYPEEANARLIAAAPALYEALKDTALAVHRLATHHNLAVPFEMCERPICVNARAALALVDGLQNQETK